MIDIPYLEDMEYLLEITTIINYGVKLIFRLTPKFI
jgi:hypothetical protein